MGLDLRDLRKPLEDVTFPNGVKHQPIPFGPAEYQLWRDMQKEKDPLACGRMAYQIIKACYPSVTDDDILDCDEDMLIALAAYPGGKIDQVRIALKNAEAAGVRPEAPPTSEVPAASAPSSPSPNGNMSSPKSRRRRGKTGGVSTTASPTDDQNSSGTATTTSRSLGESTPFAVNWTTSTERASQATP